MEAETSRYPILIAEDNDDDAQLLQHALRFTGLKNPIHIVRDGEHLIRFLEGKPPYHDRDAFPFPELLFTDLQMPRVSGFDVLKWLCQNPQYRIIPIIVFSGSAMESDVKLAYQLGANCFLSKPSDLKRYIEVIDLALRFWEVCARPQVPPGRDLIEAPVISLVPPAEPPKRAF